MDKEIENRKYLRFAMGGHSKSVALATVARGGAPPSLRSLLPVLCPLRCRRRLRLPRLWWDAGSGTAWHNSTGSEEEAAFCHPPPPRGPELTRHHHPRVFSSGASSPPSPSLVLLLCHPDRSTGAPRPANGDRIGVVFVVRPSLSSRSSGS